jgi:predicted aspartyl protease
MLIAGVLGGCAPALGPARVEYGPSEPLPLVQPSTDGRRWYVPMMTEALGPVVWFVDTGYTYSTCDDDLAAALALDPRGTVRIRGELGRVHATKARLPPMELGGHRIESLVCQVRDLGSTSSLDDPDEVPIAGVLGMDVLRRFQVSFDPSDGVMELHEPGTVPRIRASEEGVSKLKRAGVRGLRARIALEVGGRRTWPILDTGATNTYLDGAQLGLEPTYALDNVIGRGPGASGSQVRRLLSYEIDGVRIAGQYAGDVTLIDRDRRWWEPGLLGLDLLSRFEQEYDFVRGRVRLTPTDPAPLPQFSRYWPPDQPVPARILDEGVLEARRSVVPTDVSTDSSDADIALP